MTNRPADEGRSRVRTVVTVESDRVVDVGETDK